MTGDDLEYETRELSRLDSPDGAVLVVLGGETAGQTHPLPSSLGEKLRVGASDENHVVLRDDTVSRRHLEIERTESGFRLVDLGSTNGTRMAGVRLQEATLSTGAVFEVGAIPVMIGVAIEGLAVPPSSHERFGLAVGRSESIRRAFGVLERAAKTTASVLLTGETGTGKDVLARSLHLASGRTGSFEVFDCGATVPSLIESELFGHERGAFTGAVSSRPGAFERAEGGTLFIDELGELPLALQPKLLRVVETRQFRRVGGSRTLSADVRLIAATCRDLRGEVAAGRFREDLYYRLAVVSLEVPPLRNRRADIEVLVHHLLAETSTRISQHTMSRLMAHDWPGNVRELRNTIERLSCLDGPTELADDELFGVPASVRQREQGGLAGMSFDTESSYRETRARFEAEFERAYVRWLLATTNGNVSAASRQARMDRNYLSELARRHGVKLRG